MGKGHGLRKTGMQRALDPSIIGNTGLDYHPCYQIVPDLIAGDKPGAMLTGGIPLLSGIFLARKLGRAQIAVVQPDGDGHGRGRCGGRAIRCSRAVPWRSSGEIRLCAR